MHKKIRLSKKAINDLKNIWDYTLEKWGVEQAKKYTLLIELSFGEIDSEAFFIKTAGYTHRIREMGYLEYNVKRHRIILKEKKDYFFIIRILHQSMNITQHL